MFIFKSLFNKVGFAEGLSIIESQGLSALFLDEINQDHEFGKKITSSPEGKKLFIKMIGTTFNMEKQYANYERVVKDLSALASKYGLRLIVLKGYGLSLNYPVPEHRPTGDIDVYVLSSDECDYDSNYKLLDSAIANNLGIKVDQCSSHHSRFYFEGFLVENHKTVIDPDRHKENIELNQLLAQEIRRGIRRVNDVFLPSVRFNSIHLLSHMSRDFASTGTNIRKLLDWAIFVDTSYKQKDSIDWDFVFDVARNYGMLPFLNAINDICVRYAGFPCEMFPIRIEKQNEAEFHKLSDRVFIDLIKGTKTDILLSQHNILLYGSVKCVRFLKNLWKYNMVYNEIALKSLMRQSWIRIEKYFKHNYQ